MKVLDVAALFIDGYAHDVSLTNLTLNKLVYFAQVEALRRDPHSALFTDEIQAWNYGPVEPVVYDTFKKYGSSRIFTVPVHESSYEATAVNIVDTVMDKYGWMTAFDLVNYSHRAGSAWSKVYTGEHHRIITISDILNSSDIRMYPQRFGTLADAIAVTEKNYENTLRILGDA
ncbi:DUF4065 domain-containing protein [Alloscardovia theropitheci]|uniref:DUF4065 domain-containing protein n=1 Tax=Alloscardovia theropitheci TaxID=2496842 RepID=A0A4R0QRZ3_9BIFI|nr:type II toxin-antitoxin system antitoxin SocA domain-containing protein [Alloscardovia theropitheci]TCD53845.1 DUF4065 domain-containing protein [Alloscardovia theropitheci]